MEQITDLLSLALPQESYSRCSIIGLGGAAGRIVDKLKDRSIPDTKLFVFGMNRQEIDALSITDKFIIGNDGLGSGKDHNMAMLACRSSIPIIEKILSESGMTVFVVCLGGATRKSCMEMFLRNTSHSNVSKILIATLPHHLEGVEKRDDAKKSIEKMKPYVDGIIIIDYEKLEATSILSLYAKADEIIEDTVESFAGLIAKSSIICFDYQDVQYFLRKAKTKIVDFVSMNGNIDNIGNRFESVSDLLPTKYSSADDIEAMIIEICIADGCRESEMKKSVEIVSKIVSTLPESIRWYSWTMSIDRNIADNDLKLNLYLTKKQSTCHKKRCL